MKLKSFPNTPLDPIRGQLPPPKPSDRADRAQAIGREQGFVVSDAGGPYRCRVVESPQDLLLAQSVRRKVFASCLAPSLVRSGYEQSPWDLHPRMVHLLVETGEVCVGTARLIVGELHRDGRELGYGVPMEEHYDLSALQSVAHRIAELGRICVLEDHRGSGAARTLYAGMARVSLQLGVQRWVGCANSETRTLEQMARLSKTIGQMGLWADVRFELRGSTSVELDAAHVAPLDRLPAVLRSYVRWGELRFCGQAIFDDRFSRFALPFLGNPRCTLELVQGVRP